MAEVKATLSKKDEKFREEALYGNMWSILLKMGIPLALYQSLNQIFKILDSAMASHISSSAVSAIAYLAQINLMISALGSGLAVGSSLKISQAYGAGDYQLVKKRVSSLYAMCMGMSALILFVLIPLSTPLLRLANTPESLIEVGARYFSIELLGLVITFFNNVYIAIERARGGSKRILYLNIIVMIIKLSLTAYFVYILDGTIEMIAWATVISQIFLAAAAIYNMRGKENLFGFSMKAITFEKMVVAPMLTQSIPVVVEKIAFSFGKVIVNSMSTLYGDLVVGALGVSNNIGGMTTCPQNGFQEGAAAIISQNRGHGNQKRALEAFYKVMVINIVVGIIGFTVTMGFLEGISGFFAENDPEFHLLIQHVYQFEAYGAVPLGINAAVIALFYGFGETRITLLINFMRVFAFRIPVLWGLQHFTSFGSESVGIVMMVSNIAVAVFSGALAVWYIAKLHKISSKE
ncbi:MAG: MATE family efflux transporter [Lachnospiraceae bacterium]